MGEFPFLRVISHPDHPLIMHFSDTLTALRLHDSPSAFQSVSQRTPVTEHRGNYPRGDILSFPLTGLFCLGRDRLLNMMLSCLPEPLARINPARHIADYETGFIGCQVSL